VRNGYRKLDLANSNIMMIKSAVAGNLNWNLLRNYGDYVVVEWDNAIVNRARTRRVCSGSRPSLTASRFHKRPWAHRGCQCARTHQPVSAAQASLWGRRRRRDLPTGGESGVRI